jgi:hypothetical protein
MDQTAMDMGRKIRFVLQMQGIAYADAAEHVGLPAEDFQEILDGARLPSPRLLKNLAEFCRVNPDFFSGLVPAFPLAPPAAGTSPQAEMKAEAIEGGLTRKGPLTLKDLAVRFQALLELLVETGVVPAARYHEKVRAVSERAEARTAAPEDRSGPRNGPKKGKEKRTSQRS